ncbi:MAG: AAA family ATPase [Oscillospiraceae bacterium]|nr:AAA family ATPase [Oscillospiraceae bacterium]
MRILSMTATFGKLDGETLTLGSGLNVLSAPNEWGKSTWCAFLTAMLYGIDTRERSRGDILADKEKYLPWSGKPMAGTLRILHEGRDITIQRRTRGRTPMGEFLAYETQTGLPVRELTAENCGQVLLGVEKSVFLRTGFLRFSDLPVKADEALRRRLNALVTTGDETVDAERLAGKLRELRNRCRHNHTGLIPECQAQIRSAQEQLWEVQSLMKQESRLESELEQQEAELKQLEQHRSALDWKLLADARADARTAVMLETALMEKYTDNPDRSLVEAKIRQGEQLLKEVELSMAEPPTSSVGVLLTAFLAAVLLLAGLIMTDRWLICLALSAASIFACAVLAGRQKRRQLWYNIERTRRQGKRDELVNFVASWRSQLRVLDELDRARDNVTRTQNHLKSLESLVRATGAPPAEDPLTLDREETTAAILDLTRRTAQARGRLAQLRGRMELMPDEEQLQRQLALARQRLSELERTNKAIGYAQSALESALQELQRRFAPDITRRAGHFLGRLTGGIYDRISIGEDLSVLAARDSETTLRTAAWRSEGTGDQMYLALRLAVWEVLSPESPLILDDALVRFDQTRMKRAMDLLTELGENRQILLFSCQDREKEYLER